MKIKVLFALLACLAYGSIGAQTLEELYNKSDYKSLIEYEAKADELSNKDLFYVGYAFFQLENDKKAVEMYDKAIEKGLDDDIIYLYKGLSLRYDKQFDKAIESFKLAVNRNPNGQKNYTELANCFYLQSQYDSALVYFYKARELEFEHGDPYFKIPLIHHIQEDYEKALDEYRLSAALIDKTDPVYVKLQASIGQLEYAVYENYEKAIGAYSKAISQAPTNYDLYPKLIKAYYANEDYDEGNDLFEIMKKEYENGGLPDTYQKYGNAPIAEFDWNGQTVSVFKYFKEPTETLDLMYKIYLLSKDGKSVERTLMTEKTLQFEEDGPKHLLCERGKAGEHHTYPYGWSTDQIDFPGLKKAVIAVLNKKTSPAASSKFGTDEDGKK